MPGSLGTFNDIFIYKRNIEWIYVLFSLRMAVLLHKWEFKNIEVEFLKVSENILSPGLPDIGARTSWLLKLMQALYNDIYFQKSLWPIFFLFLPGSCHWKLGELDYTAINKFGSQ